MKKVSIILSIALLSCAIGIGFFYLKKQLGPHTARGAELVPAETLFFAQLPDLARTRERWFKTALSDLLKEPEMQEFMEKPLAKIARDSAWQGRFSHLVRIRPREAFVAVTSIDGPMPRFVIGLCYSGSKSQVEALLAEPRAALRKAWPAGKADLINYGSSEIEIYSEKENVMAGAFRGDWYFAANNLELLERTLDRHDQGSGSGGTGGKPGGTLADSALFAATVSKVSEDRDGLVFAQLGTVMERISGLMAASGQKVEDSQLAGLKKAQAIAASTKIEGKQFRDTVFLLSPGTKVEETLQRHSLAMTSPGTVLYYVAGLPASLEMPESLLSMSALWLPATMQKRMEEKGLALADLSKAFGPEFGTVVDWPQTTSQPSFIVAFDVRDSVKAQAFLEVLTGGAGEEAWEKSEGEGPVVYSAPASEELPLVTPSVALTERFFLVGLTADAVGPALERFKEGVPAVNTTPKFEAALRAVATPTGSFGYVDLAGLCERAYERIFRPFAVMSMTFAPEAGEYIDAGKLPSTATVIKHFGPMVLSQSSSEEGTLFESAGTLTFGQLLLGGAAGGIVAALPNLGALGEEGGLSGSKLFQLAPGSALLPAAEAPAEAEEPKAAR